MDSLFHFCSILITWWLLLSLFPSSTASWTSGPQEMDAQQHTVCKTMCIILPCMKVGSAVSEEMEVLNPSGLLC